MRDEARQLAEAREAKERAREIFPRFGSVNAIGLTRKGDGYAVRVSFEKEPRNRAQMPVEIEGVPVIVRILGPIQKQTA